MPNKLSEYIDIVFGINKDRIIIRPYRKIKKNVCVLNTTRNNHTIKVKRTIYLDIGSKHVISNHLI